MPGNTLESIIVSELQWIFVGGKGGVGKTTTSCSLALLIANHTPAGISAEEAAAAAAASSSSSNNNNDTNNNNNNNNGIDNNEEDNNNNDNSNSSGGRWRPKRVLLISTDPAHNLSDAFNQKIKSEPTQVRGTRYGNLYAMEIDATSAAHGQIAKVLGSSSSSSGAFPSSAGSYSDHRNNNNNNNNNSSNDPSTVFSSLRSIIGEAASHLPGIDEVSVFAEILITVKRQRLYDVILFDTAPTGHTLRLLSLPDTAERTLERIQNTQGIETIMQAAAHFFQSNNNNSNNNGNNNSDASGLSYSGGAGRAESGNSGDGASHSNNNSNNNNISSADAADQVVDYREMLGQWLDIVREVQATFTDSSRTAFVCVCIAEFLSVYETERLIQQLMRYNINCEHIVVNQLLLKPQSESNNNNSDINNNNNNNTPCRMCEARKAIQAKYLSQIDDLYAEDFAIVRMPLCVREVRGAAGLDLFGSFLLSPYDPDTHGYLEPPPC